MDEVVSVRRRPPWKWMIAIGALTAAIVGGVWALFAWQERSDERAALDKAERVYRELAVCTLGGDVAGDVLGRRVVEAESTGALNRTRLERCAKAARAGLATIQREHPDVVLPVDFLDQDLAPHEIDDHFGVCATLAYARKELARRLGRKETRPDCDPHIAPLRPVTSQGPDEEHHRWVIDGQLYIDVVQRDQRLPGHQLRRSRDGSSWEELDAPPGFWNPHWAPEGGWSYQFVKGDDTAHYAVLDGTTWRPGARARGGREIDWRRTDTGWTLVLETTDDGAEVVWLDPLMQRIVAHRPVLALRGRFTWDAPPPFAMIDERGDVVVYALRTGANAIEVEAHAVTRAAAPKPSATALPVTRPEPELAFKSCRSGDTLFLVVPGHAVVTGGSPPLRLTADHVPEARALACTADRLVFTDGRQLARCDRSRCEVAPVPVAAALLDQGESRLDLVDDGRVTRLLLATGARVYLFEAAPGAALSLVDLWSWDQDHLRDAPTVRLRDSWFLL